VPLRGHPRVQASHGILSLDPRVDALKSASDQSVPLKTTSHSSSSSNSIPHPPSTSSTPIITASFRFTTTDPIPSSHLFPSIARFRYIRGVNMDVGRCLSLDCRWLIRRRLSLMPRSYQRYSPYFTCGMT
jgi:hypothetical protein